MNNAVKHNGNTLPLFMCFSSLVSLCYSFNLNNRIGSPIRDLFPTHTADIIKSHGYPVETHTVETEDGYILEVFRIPPLPGTNSAKRLPVLLTHGNFQSSSEWVINRPVNASFAFILHNSGYDVWLGNNRGNPYGSRHKWINVDTPKFWNYTFHEMGIYDMPATIDYVLNSTGKRKLHYVSLSMGPACFLAGLSHKPEYNHKIASAVLMGATVFMGNFYSGATYVLSSLWRIVNVYMNIVGSMPTIPHALGRYMSSVFPRMCDPKLDLIGFCYRWIHLVYGNDEGLMTKEQIAQVFATTPASGSSLKLSNHVLQLWGSKRFAEYNYGRMGNMRAYGRSTPPDYDLSKATVPIALFAGKSDIMGNSTDIKRLASLLPNLIEYYESPYERFGHLNFVYGREVAAELYYRAIYIFKSFEGN